MIIATLLACFSPSKPKDECDGITDATVFKIASNPELMNDRVREVFADGYDFYNPVTLNPNRSLAENGFRYDIFTTCAQIRANYCLRNNVQNCDKNIESSTLEKWAW